MDRGRRPAAGVELRDEVRYALDRALERPQFLDASELSSGESLFRQVRFLPPFRFDAGRCTPVA